jgi:uncharacterized phosphosugar-binding protein
MSKLMKEYYQKASQMLESIMDNEEENINSASKEMAKRIRDGKTVFVFGTGGHSIMGAEEMFYRAGGLQPINAMLDTGVSLTQGGRHSTFIERTPNIAHSLLDYYGVNENDVIIIINVNGINSMTIEGALESKKRGATVIGVTSADFANNVPKGASARHSSNKNLHEIADIVIDPHVPVGDALLEVPGVPVKVGPSSTLAVALCLNMLQVTTIEILLSWGVTPPVWMSANIPGGDEFNKKFINEFSGIIRHL